MPPVARATGRLGSDLSSWLSLARRLEASGFDALLVGDHPGGWASPWVALGAAAAVTRTLRLGTYMVQAGVREPVHTAGDAATLDILAPGRVVLGFGAGVRLVVGGGHLVILRAAARHADVVALSGVGRMLPDGRQHEVRWSPGDLERQLRIVWEEARQAGRSPVLEALESVLTLIRQASPVRPSSE